MQRRWYARPAMDTDALEQEACAALEAASSAGEVESIRVEYLGRKSALKLALREVRDRDTGIALNASREQLEAAIEARGRARARRARRRLDRGAGGRDATGGAYRRGRLHLITQVRREVEDIFLGLGYRVVDGSEVETTHYNFDGLNFPPGHPARSQLASLFLDDETVLRTETSPSQIRTMEAQRPPVYIVTLGRDLPAGHAGRHPHAHLPPGRGARRRRGHHARRPHRDARLPASRAVRR